MKNPDRVVNEWFWVIAKLSREKRLGITVEQGWAIAETLADRTILHPIEKEK